MFFRNSDKPTEFRVLSEINSLLLQGEYPSVSKIAKRLGMENSLNSIQISNNKLVSKGFLVKSTDWKISSITESWLAFLNQSDGVSLANVFRSIKVPILWTIACGNPIYAFEDIKGYASVSEQIVGRSNPNDFFILEATWDSMNQKWINPGDLLLFRQKSFANNGEIVLALISNESATLKELRQSSAGFIQLIPHSDNPEHETLIVRSEDLIIQGVFLENIGNFDT